MAGTDPGALIAERYRLGATLGAGGMGAVYRARDELLGEDVALKVLLTPDPAAMGRMRDEVRLGRRVTHRNVARTFDIGMHEGSPFVTMELLEGPSLRSVLRSPVGVPRIVGLLAQVADGLATAHRAEVVHRDLKPSNVIVVASGEASDGLEESRAVLIDFGVSMAVGQGTAGVSGTWDYMSPEQLRGDPASSPSDVFALGVLIFHALSGAMPYAGATAHERALARVQVRPDFRALFDAPIALIEIVEACLADAPLARPAADQVAASLRAWRVAPLGAADAPAAPGEDDAKTEFLPLRAAGPASLTLASARKERILVVAPLVGVGTELSRSLAAGVTTNLAERLARASGLLVASSAFLDGVDPAHTRDAARAAHLDLLIEGTLEVAAAAVSVDLRVIDLGTDSIVLARRVTSPVGGLLDLAADLAGRVAEALRVELEVATSGASISPRAVELYLAARHALRSPELGRSNITQLFEECLALAPGFVPAKVSRALAMARVYSFANQRAGADEEVEAVIREAEALAPDAPDACAARGSFELQRGRLRTAIACFRRALELAPTHPFALEQLGRIACEAGRTREGIERLELAATLDPMAQTSLCLVARSFALRGRLEEYRAVLRRIPTGGPRFIEVARLELRVADWYGDVAVAERHLAEWPEVRPPDTRTVIFGLASIVAGRKDGWARFEEMERYVLGSPVSPRFRAIVLQGSAELRARRDPERALSFLEETVALPFFDMEWMELCPVLDGLRDHPRFVAAQRTLRSRLSAVWGDAS